jgi:hypothetical protein
MNPTNLRRQIAAVLTLSVALFAFVTPTALANQPVRDYPGDRLQPQTVAKEDPLLARGYQVEKASEIPFVGRFDGKPDGYQPVKFEPVVTTATVAGSGIQWDEMAYGLALGVGLALLAAVATAAIRHRGRVILP